MWSCPPYRTPRFLQDPFSCHGRVVPKAPLPDGLRGNPQEILCLNCPANRPPADARHARPPRPGGRITGLPRGAAKPLRLLAAFQEAEPYLGLPVHAYKLVAWLVKQAQPQDWEEGSRPIAWPSARHQACRRHGRSSSTGPSSRPASSSCATTSRASATAAAIPRQSESSRPSASSSPRSRGATTNSGASRPCRNGLAKSGAEEGVCSQCDTRQKRL